VVKRPGGDRGSTAQQSTRPSAQTVPLSHVGPRLRPCKAPRFPGEFGFPRGTFDTNRSVPNQFETGILPGRPLKAEAPGRGNVIHPGRPVKIKQLGGRFMVRGRPLAPFAAPARPCDNPHRKVLESIANRGGGPGLPLYDPRKDPEEPITGPRKAEPTRMDFRYF